MTVRTSQSSDRDELIRMRLLLWPDSDPDEVDEVLERPEANGRVLVWEREDRGLGGFLELGLRDYAEGCIGRPVPYVEGIWIDEDLRREGIGTALVRGAEDWSLGRGFAELASDCNLLNVQSLAFHLAAGFTEVERVICFRRELAGPSGLGGPRENADG